MSEAEPSPIFRQAALNRLGDPEQLDLMLPSASPGDWIAAAALFAIAATALVWSIVGTVVTRVSGNGILVAQGGSIFTPIANGDGLVMEMTVRPGDRVTVGQRLARVAQPDLEQRLAAARAVVAENEQRLAAVREQVSHYASARSRNISAQAALLRQQEADARAKAEDLAVQLLDAQALLQRGITTRTRVSELTQALAVARQGVTEARSSLVRLDAGEISVRNTDDRDLRAAETDLAEARRQLAAARADLDRKGWVTSPTAGHVIEIKTPAGTRVVAGMPVAAVENGSAALQLILYVPPRDGKRIQRGMRVNVSPSVARREQFGTILGRVVEVSNYPATREAMLATLENDQLVKELSADGAPIVARVLLDRNPATRTGYAWAGGSGPPVPLTSGTIAVAQVTVEREAPISFALPFLRSVAGM